jgi:hypothetical protein
MLCPQHHSSFVKLRIVKIRPMVLYKEIMLKYKKSTLKLLMKCICVTVTYKSILAKKLVIYTPDPLRRLMTCTYLLEQKHDLDPRLRFLADEDKTGFTVQTVVALQGAGEEQLCYTTSHSI